MINFSTIKFKNFLSYGNTFTEIELNKHPNSLLIGKNGNGKCLVGDTNINILINNEEISRKFKDFLESKNTF